MVLRALLGFPYLRLESYAGDHCAEKSQFAYIVGGVAGFVVLAIICVLFVWMICVRSNKKKQPEAAKAMTLPPDAGSQVWVQDNAEGQELADPKGEGAKESWPPPKP